MRNSAAARFLLAALPALFAPSLRADSSAQKYYYEDITQPFFAPDPVRPGWMKSQRPGSKDGAFLKEKPAGTFRVFVLGGSIASLLQYDGGPGDLGPVLQAALPGRAVEVLNCGMAGYETFREALVEQEILEYSPDLLVFLTGHNEGIAAAPIPLWVMKAQERLSRFEAYRAWVRKVRPSDEAGAGFGDAKADARDAAFRRNLAENLRRARERGVPAAVVIPPRNYREPAELSRGPYDAEFVPGWIRFLRGDWKGARDFWKGSLEAAGRTPSSEERSFTWGFIGRAEEKLGRWKEAREAFDRAAADDRAAICGGICQGILRETAASEGAFLVEADAMFRGLLAPRAPGLETFNDRMHWKPRFNCLVSAEIASAARARPELAALPWSDHGLKAVRGSCPVPAAGSPGDEADDARILGYVRMGLSWPKLERLSTVSVFYLEAVRRARPAWFGDLDALAVRAPNPMTQVYGMEMAPASVLVPRLRWHVAETRLLERDWKGAEKDFAAALAADPGLGWARLSRAAAAALAGERKAAARLLAEAVERADGEHRSRLVASAAAAAAELGLDAAAVAAADPGSLIAAAEKAAAEGRRDEARAALARARAARPEDYQWRLIAQGYTRLRDDHGFIEVAGELISRYPKDADARLLLAESLFAVGRKAEGEDALAQAEKLATADGQRRLIAGWRAWLKAGAPAERMPR